MKLILNIFLSCLILPFVLNANNKSNTPVSKCPSTYFDCGDGSCVSVLFLCDGEADCQNGADEKCNGTIHSEKSLVCEDDKFNCPGLDFCLPMKWRCDGHKDCPNGEDEKNCSNAPKCNGFHCKSGECIPEKWKCDNNFDCLDGSDEENCRSTRINKHCIRENGYFECASGQCISHDLVCNGKNDCTDGEDEGKFCEIDGCHSKNCTHGCFQTPQGPQCDCNNGYKLNSDQRTCIDIDECKESNNDICSQKCTNTKGSFSCSCEPGFKLINKTICEVESSEPVLLYTDAHNVRGYWLKQKLHFLIARGLSNAMGVDMHRDSKLVFWTDIGENSSYIFSAHFHSKDVKPIVTSGLKTPEDIAVDYVANNLYITDAGLKQIIVCKLDGSSCTPVIKRGIDSVRAIALDISNGRIFWTDWGTKPGIYTSRMDGSRMRALVNRNIIWPNGLTYDKFKNRIYWSDAKLERIEYYDLTKNKRFVLIDDAVYHPHCLTMFEDNIYWADWDSMSVSSSNKFSGHNMTQVLRRPNKIYGMHIYHPVHYTSSNNPCWSSSCSHLCLIQSATEFKCACPNNMKLDPKDKTTCIEKEELNNLFVGLDYTIKQIYSKNIGKDVTRKLFKNLPAQLEYISEYAYSIRNAELYLHNSLTKGIIKYDLKKQVVSSIIYQQNNLSSIYSMIYDEFSNNLYWLDTGKQELVVASVDERFNNQTRNPVTLLNKLSDPSSMVLYQERNELYIGQMGTKPRIIVADLNGKNSKTLIENIGWPTSLAIDKQKNLLYFADARKGTIESISIDDPTTKTIVKKNVGHIESLAVDGNLIYYTDMDTPYLYTIDLNKNNDKATQISVGYSKVTKKLLIVHRESSAINNDCLNENNKCTDVCLFGGLKLVNNLKVPLSYCACPIDSSLSEDKYTCKTRKHCPDGYFTCDSTKTCIRQSSVCDGHKDCENNEDESGCSYVKPCSMFESRCDPKNLTSHCIPNAWFCDGENDCENGFDELNCHNQTTANKTIYDNVAHKSAINGQCENGYFKCDIDVCIPWHFVCNGEINCKDKKDEGPNCLEKCECKHNGRCHLNDENIWSCQCSPEYTGFDCSIKVDLQSRSNDNHEFVMKESIHSKGRITNEDAFDSNNSNTDSFWLIMLLVVIVLMIVGLVLFGYIYMFETDGRMYLLKRNLNRKFNFRHSSFKDNKYDFNSATADLLDRMECELDEEDNQTPQQQLNNQQIKYV